MVNIVATLGAGSGIDSARLADDLVAAARAPRAAAIAARRSAVTAELGALAQVRAGVAGLTDTVTSLAMGARLREATATGDRAALAGIVIDLAAALDQTRGALPAQPQTRAIREALARMSTLSVGGTSLAALGVATDRSGALRVDRTRLAAALDREPRAVQTLVAGPGGLAAALDKLQRELMAAGGPLASVEARLRRSQGALDRAAADLDVRSAAQRSQLVRQFSAMERAVGAYRSQQTSVQQQVDAWTAGLRGR
jgi:flagellar capping protein FliD